MVDVVVPVLGRPHRAVPFVQSFTASVSPDAARLTVVTEPAGRDTATTRAWRAAVPAAVGQVIAIPNRPGTFARKVNHAFRHTSGPWLLMVGDDVEFHPGWLPAALAVAETTGARVVGTNDRGLDRKGMVAPHPMIARSYITGRGASWDGPGKVCHEGYNHTCVDHEIALVAQSRDTWAYAEAAVIEHHHFLNKKARQDATYRKGMSKARQDMDLLKRRARRHGASVHRG